MANLGGVLPALIGREVGTTRRLPILDYLFRFWGDTCLCKKHSRKKQWSQNKIYLPSTKIRDTRELRSSNLPANT